jgi:uncharacterized protein (TIGR03118 family)
MRELKPRSNSARLPHCALIISAYLAFSISVALCQQYTQTNLVSDLPGVAQIQDTNLVNPWGLARSSGSPWWVANNGTGTATLYNGAGVKQLLTVTVPSNAVGGTGNPTGIVFNGSAFFTIPPTTFPGIFLFASEDGSISGWNPNVNPTNAITLLSRPLNSVFKGATIAQVAFFKLFYVADFKQGKVKVYDTNFKPLTLFPFAFQDFTLPDGFAPFNVQNIGNKIYVAFAKQDAAKHDNVNGPGLGFVDVFSRFGFLLKRFEAGPWFNAPWGMVVAPSDFGSLSHKLLVGQFGSGQILSFDLITGSFEGTLQTTQGTAFQVPGLWGLGFGAGNTNSGPANTLYFNAGINDENNGLFGSLAPIAADLDQGNGQ